MSNYTPADLIRIAERLAPDKLFLVRAQADLPDDLMQALWLKIMLSSDPDRRACNLEYLLLLLHAGRVKDAKVYLETVFLPWIGIKQRLVGARQQLGDKFAALSDIEENSETDIRHTAEIYRLMVAEIYDPYLTLLMATIQFCEGTFVDIDQSNVGYSELTKKEFIEKRIREAGGPLDLLDGHSALVRNALSHAGSEGVLIEVDTLLFKNIKRQIPPVVTAERWTFDELRMHNVHLLDFVMAVEAAVEVFAIDCQDLLEDPQTRAYVLFHALSKDQRRDIFSASGAMLKAIREDVSRSLRDRIQTLSAMFFAACDERHMARGEVGYREANRMLGVQLTCAQIPAADDSFIVLVAPLPRYGIVARAIFGDLMDLCRITLTDQAGKQLVMGLKSHALDDYQAESAGLVDLLAEAQIFLDGDEIAIAFDQAKLQEAEEAQLGPRFPRRGRPVSG